MSVVRGTLSPARARAMCERGRPDVDAQGALPRLGCCSARGNKHKGGGANKLNAVGVLAVVGGWKASRLGCLYKAVADGALAAGGQPYTAAALSLVFHPAHPHVPTLRADVRRFEVRCQADACSSEEARVCPWAAPARLGSSCVGLAAAAP